MLAPRFCGPKLSICCSVLSVWGIVMLVLMGIFLGVNSAAFAEDLGIKESDVHNATIMYGAYRQESNNCLIAAGLYVLTLGVSVWQYSLNRRAVITT